MTPLRSLVSLTLAPAAIGMLVFGCATGGPADFVPTVDPSLPGVDAGNAPSRVVPSKSAPDGGADDDDDGQDDGEDDPVGSTDAGPKVTKDAGPSGPVVPMPSAGEILITEVLYDSVNTEPDAEWIEVHSTATANRSLSGLTIKDGAGRTHVIGAGVTIAPGAYAVLSRSTAGATAAKLPSAKVVYTYGVTGSAGIQLANAGTGGVSLLNGATVLADAPYGGWFTQSGGCSVQLKVLDFSQSSAKASWCLSTTSWATGTERGTPGAPSDCP